MDEHSFRIALLVVSAVVLLSVLDALVRDFSASAGFGVLGIIAGAVGTRQIFRGNGNGKDQG